MPTDQRRPDSLHPTAFRPPAPKMRRVLATAISLAATLIAATLWTGAGSAAAMGLRGFGGDGIGLHRGQAFRGQVFRGQGSRGQVFRGQVSRGPLKGRIVARDNPSSLAWRRVGSRDVRPGGDSDRTPRHPTWPRWPHRPVIGTIPLIPVAPVGPVGPIGLANVPPSGAAAPPTPPAAGAGGGAQVNVPAANERRYVPDEVLVSFTGGVSPQAVVGFAQNQRLALLGIHRLPLINTVLYRFRITDQRAVPAVLGSLQGDGRVGAAQPNYLYALQDAGQPTITGDPAQYVVAKLHLPEAHAFTTGSRALVAVIDSAIDAAHPELKGAVAGSFDTIKSVPLPHEHGTAMASAIAAHGRLLGVAPAARILAVRAFDGASASAQAATTRVLDGLQWTADSGARVVNMSFTGPADPKLHEMVASARKKGLVLIAAAGNDGPQAAPDYPAAYSEVIAVTATDVDDRLFRVANRGPYVSVAAPGVDIMVATPRAGYGFTTGTSVATAHVSGLAALLIDRNPALTPDQVQAILMRTAKDLGTKGRDDEFGAGLVDAYEALLTLAPATAEQNATR